MIFRTQLNFDGVKTGRNQKPNAHDFDGFFLICAFPCNVFFFLLCSSQWKSISISSVCSMRVICNAIMMMLTEAKQTQSASAKCSQSLITLGSQYSLSLSVFFFVVLRSMCAFIWAIFRACHPRCFVLFFLWIWRNPFPSIMRFSFRSIDRLYKWRTFLRYSAPSKPN